MEHASISTQDALAGTLVQIACHHGYGAISQDSDPGNNITHYETVQFLECLKSGQWNASVRFCQGRYMPTCTIWYM